MELTQRYTKHFAPEAHWVQPKVRQKQLKQATMIRYLMDENVNPNYQTQLLRREPGLVVWAVGDPGAPPKSTLDPEILIWCEEHGFVLVTNNRTSMPPHLAEHLAQGRHVPGIFILNPKLSIGEMIDELILIALASEDDEYQDRIRYLPLKRSK